MIKTEKIIYEWDQINSYVPSYLEENISKLSPSLLIYLITTLMEQEEFEIGTFEEGRQKGASIWYTGPDKDKHLELRVKKSSTYEFILSVIKQEEEPHLFRHRLEKEEIESIPKTLRDRLEKVKDLGEPVSFYSSQIIL
ncbi:MAG: hypothetical protein K0S32_2822 [Bacteroidetes bacterium]|jgi:hypothetical protein|nr:hypothetical protein [Bacteroidota bacterium]